jgi:hypothetical protein
MKEIEMVEKMLDHLEKSILPQMNLTVGNIEKRIEALY